MRRLPVLVLPLLIAAGAALPIQSAAQPAAAGAPAAASPDPAALTGTVWSWRRALKGVEPPDPPKLFTVEFIKGGKIKVLTECYEGSASFILDGSAIKMTPVKPTKYLCPPGWKDRALFEGLEGVATWTVANGELVLATSSDLKTMRFQPLNR